MTWTEEDELWAASITAWEEALYERLAKEKDIDISVKDKE